MNFKKYSSIENSYREKYIDCIKNAGYHKYDYWVSEKAHGASYAIHIKKNELIPYKRSGIAGSEFFSHQKVLTKYFGVFQELYKKYGEIVLNGELIGGNYPHPDVDRTNSPSVQKGVYYHPDIEFYLFDARKKDNEFFSLEDFTKLATSSGLCWAKPLFVGSFDNCLGYNNEYESTIPSFFSLPKIDGNICEGNVIKPIIDLYLGSGSRVILKNKNKKFSEISSAKKPKIKTPLTAEQNIVLNEVQNYITENRLRNVISKIGIITQNEFAKLNGQFIQDVLADYYVDGGNADKQVKQETSKMTSQFIRERFLNIIDGNF